MSLKHIFYPQYYVNTEFGSCHLNNQALFKTYFENSVSVIHFMGYHWKCDVTLSNQVISPYPNDQTAVFPIKQIQEFSQSPFHTPTWNHSCLQSIEIASSACIPGGLLTPWTIRGLKPSGTHYSAFKCQSAATQVSPALTEIQDALRHQGLPNLPAIPENCRHQGLQGRPTSKKAKITINNNQGRMEP